MGQVPPIRELCPAKEIIPASRQDGQGQLRTFHREAVCRFLGGLRRSRSPAKAQGQVTLALAAPATPAAIQVFQATFGSAREILEQFAMPSRNAREKTLQLSHAMTGLSLSVQLPCKASGSQTFHSRRLALAGMRSGSWILKLYPRKPT